MLQIWRFFLTKYLTHQQVEKQKVEEGENSGCQKAGPEEQRSLKEENLCRRWDPAKKIQFGEGSSALPVGVVEDVIGVQSQAEESKFSRFYVCQVDWNKERFLSFN